MSNGKEAEEGNLFNLSNRTFDARHCLNWRSLIQMRILRWNHLQAASVFGARH